MAEKKEELSFEQAMNRLNEIVNILQNGTASLDDSLKLFQEGMELSKLCDEKLKLFEKQVKDLTENLKDDSQN